MGNIVHGVLYIVAGTLFIGAVINAVIGVYITKKKAGEST